MAENSIELDSVEIAAAIFGNCDRNIRLLEKEFSVTAVCRGTMLRLSGEEANVAAAVRAVEGMLLLIENHTPLEDQTVRYCLSLAHDGKEQRVRELTEDFVTVTALSEMLGMTPNHLSAIERGASGISLEALQRLCRLLGVSADRISLGLTSQKWKPLRLPDVFRI